MWHINQLQIAQERQREMREEAESWRLANHKEDYQPNQHLHRTRRKRRHEGR